MTKHLFLYQEKLEQLVLTRQAVLSGNQLLFQDRQLSLLLTPAVKVLSCETALKDPFHLTGKFIPSAVLTRCGADLFLSSFIYRKHSYRIETGFLSTMEQHIS